MVGGGSGFPDGNTILGLPLQGSRGQYCSLMMVVVTDELFAWP